MQARLGFLTCDKCGRPLDLRQRVIIIAEGITGNVDHQDDLLLFHGDGVRYAATSPAGMARWSRCSAFPLPASGRGLGG